MKVIFGPKILIPTRHGEFDVTYVEVSLNHNIIREGVLLYKEPLNEEDIYVRVQSSCLFSESFWATDCDCALQLQNAMQYISEQGGYVLYFYEEGRGAGLNTKFKAIELQQIHKYDTRKAYECLNLTVDERSFEAAATVIKEITNKDIILLTNNEGKVNGLEKYGVKIKRRMPWIFGNDQEAIKKYLAEKRDSLGHIIP
jgi:GTP cyclohydrolase II